MMTARRPQAVFSWRLAKRRKRVSLLKEHSPRWRWHKGACPAGASLNGNGGLG